MLETSARRSMQRWLNKWLYDKEEGYISLLIKEKIVCCYMMAKIWIRKLG
jgi:hypothetical protein